MMVMSVRMDPLLERELELAAQRKGVTKSQFVIEAVERALGRKNPYELLLKLQAEETVTPYKVGTTEAAYDADKSKAKLLAKLKAKHGVGRTR
jgi:predicted DNA-binding protein